MCVCACVPLFVCRMECGCLAVVTTFGVSEIAKAMAKVMGRGCCTAGRLADAQGVAISSEEKMGQSSMALESCSISRHAVLGVE